MHRTTHGWSRWSALFGLGVLLLQVTAAAQTQTPAHAYLQKATQFYDALQYENALLELRSARQRALTKNETAPILLFEGIILADLLRKDEASAAFKEALRLQPEASLPLRDVSPKISRMFEDARAALTFPKPEPAKRPAEPAQQAEQHPPDSEQPQEPQVEVTNDVSPIFNFTPILTLPNPPAATPPVRAEEIRTTQIRDSHILIPAGAGGALAIAGGIFWGLARMEYSRIKSNDPRLNSLAAVQTSASNGRTYQTVGFSLMGAGLVGLGLAAGLYGIENRVSSMDLSVGTNGSQAVFHGRW